ncbi:unnamed protein product [Caenorhabditis bovis]|uniref:Core Histone H2A/H2B/H3 domain-containing protein n=1 Tax=Caenorhabditis bovis TaxID=2654633 RepID=A0A8S1EZ18_9PELO|nr:unnamed protein product [Caenorhabditis bovis]
MAYRMSTAPNSRASGVRIVEVHDSPVREPLRVIDRNTSETAQLLVSVRKLLDLTPENFQRLGADKYLDYSETSIRKLSRRINELTDDEIDLLENLKWKVQDVRRRYEDREEEIARRSHSQSFAFNREIGRHNSITVLQDRSNDVRIRHRRDSYESDRTSISDRRKQHERRIEQSDESDDEVPARRSPIRQKRVPLVRGKNQSTLKKMKRYKPGMKALKEIRQYQRSTDLLISKAPFRRVILEIMNELFPNVGYRIQAEALAALQEAAEAFLVNVFESSQLLSSHAGRVTLRPNDIQLYRRLCL